jgi:hypothetical protein
LTGQKKKENDSDALATLANQNTSLIVCRICGKKGDHWTSKCPYKDLAAAKGMATVRVPFDRLSVPMDIQRGATRR